MNHLIAGMVVAAVAASQAHAQDWAKARLEKSPRHQEFVKVKHGDREVQSFIVHPEVKDKATAVVVIHEIFGLTDWVRNVADQLAEAGYIAISSGFIVGHGTEGRRHQRLSRGKRRHHESHPIAAAQAGHGGFERRCGVFE